MEQSPENSPLTFIPGDGSVITVIEQAVVNSGTTKNIKLTVAPKDAFGEFDPLLIFQVKRRAFKSSEPLKLHQTIYANTPKGKCLVRITKITKDTVTVNGNHELAGKTLYIEITVIK
jgi:FKBP-type peptidyl-prolyl cis-trans isomerase SlyD